MLNSPGRIESKLRRVGPEAVFATMLKISAIDSGAVLGAEPLVGGAFVVVVEVGVGVKGEGGMAGRREEFENGRIAQVGTGERDVADARRGLRAITLRRSHRDSIVDWWSCYRRPE